jgi:pimeloyl-ACP methyl ester carboxylesterase
MTIFKKCFLLLIYVVFTRAIRIADDEVVKYIKSEGYNAEAHEVVTDDGYILRVHRVPPVNGKTNKPPIIMMHSAFSNSLYWLNTGPNISAGFYFPDHGYDVWLGNVRGSKYATKHKWLSVESNEYWRFSYHEMGVFDLKTTVDYTLEQTGARGCFYMGHSQSTTQLLAFLSIRPDYNQKIFQSHLMSAVGAFANPRFPLRTLSPLYIVSTKYEKLYDSKD